MKKITVGCRVRLTGDFLRNTGQVCGGEGQSKWNVVECDCGLCETGDYVAVNQPHICQSDPTGYEDLPVEKRPKYRHINIHNLETCR